MVADDFSFEIGGPSVRGSLPRGGRENHGLPWREEHYSGQARLGAWPEGWGIIGMGISESGHFWPSTTMEADSGDFSAHSQRGFSTVRDGNHHMA